MKVLVPGHLYVLENFENPEKEGQTIQFIEKVPVSENSTELKTISDGTTNEELLKVEIDRLKYLNIKFPCRENSIVITKLEEALMWLEKRTRDRVERGVEGKQIK
jgi:hypothetical protein